MTDKEKEELIAALEKATGPNRALDCRIYCIVDPEFKPSDLAGQVEGINRRQLKGAPIYTASIDAALTLVPPGFMIDNWFIGTDKSSCLDLLDNNLSPIERVRAEADTPAIALCIAALRARSLPEVK